MKQCGIVGLSERKDKTSRDDYNSQVQKNYRRQAEDGKSFDQSNGPLWPLSESKGKLTLISTVFWSAKQLTSNQRKGKYHKWQGDRKINKKIARSAGKTSQMKSVLYLTGLKDAY